MFRSKIFQRYLFLFVGVALLACTLAGFTLLYVSSHEMEQMSERELEKRTSTAADDYSTQIQRLAEIALQTSVEYTCSPQVARRSVMHELDLIELLHKFNQSSQWDESIFLYYPQDEVIFNSTAKYHSHVFSSYLMLAEEPETLMEQIKKAGWAEWVPLDDSHSLLVFPLKSMANGEAMYCLFDVSHASLTKQTTFVSALDSGILPASEQIPEHARLISRNSVFSLWCTENNAFEAQKGTLIGTSLNLLILLGLVFIAIAVFFAWLCYLPIRRMTARFLSGERFAENELESLSSMLNQTLNDKHYSQHLLSEQIHRMDEQKDALRRQLLQLLLNGQTEFTTGDILIDVGIHLPGPCYGLMLIEQQEPVPFPEIKRLVKELSDESLSFYVVETDGRVVVLCSMPDSNLLSTAFDMLNAACEASGYQFAIRTSRVCTNLAELPEMFGKLKAGNDEQINEHEAPRWYDDGSLNVIFSAIRQGKAETAREQMRLLISGIAERHMPETLQRCAYIDIFNRLIQCALDARLPVPGELGGQLLEANAESEVMWLFSRIIDKMTDTQSAAGSSENSALAFVNYVDEHACEINFNINSMTDIFGLSAKYIARQIREQVGMPYRNYIIHLRIKEACRLLRSTDTPVSEIHERVGYSSASHFVKVFRTVTGMTPSAYRMDGYMLSSDVIRLDALDDVDA